MDQKLAEMFAQVRSRRPDLDDGLARMQCLVEELSGSQGGRPVGQATASYLKKLIETPGPDDRADLEKMLVTFENLKTLNFKGIGLFAGVGLALLFIVINLWSDGLDIMKMLPFLAGGPVLAVFTVFGRKHITPRLAAINLALAAGGIYYGIGLYRNDPNKDVLLVWGLIGGAGVAALMALSILLRPRVKRL